MPSNAYCRASFTLMVSLLGDPFGRPPSLLPFWNGMLSGDTFSYSRAGNPLRDDVSRVTGTGGDFPPRSKRGSSRTSLFIIARSTFLAQSLFAPRRRYPREYLTRGIRRCDSSPRRFQLRIRVGPLKNDSVNFGTYPSDAEARRVRKLVSKLWKPPMSIWAVMRMLQDSGDVPAKIRPRWAYRSSCGTGYIAKVTQGPNRCQLPRIYASAEEAHDAMREHLRLPPLGPRVR